MAKSVWDFVKFWSESEKRRKMWKLVESWSQSSGRVSTLEKLTREQHIKA